jgi:hypothetical protein
MHPSSVWKRDNATTVGKFCPDGPDGGGAWAAAQALIAFLVANILAHAATIRIRAGSKTASIVRHVIAAILLPVTAGDYAFRALGRWATWMFRHRDPGPSLKQAVKQKEFIRGDTLIDAVTAGAVAICVPMHLAPLLVGRWEMAKRKRIIVMLDDSTHFWGKDEKPGIHSEIKVVASFSEYVPFILPPDVQFVRGVDGDQLLRGSEGKSRRIVPDSGVLSGIVAVAQIILGVRELYRNYSSSVQVYGLGSPYLVVIPYFLMSFVNLLAGILVGSYSRITMLNPKGKNLGRSKPAYIIECTRLECRSYISHCSVLVTSKPEGQTPAETCSQVRVKSGVSDGIHSPQGNSTSEGTVSLQGKLTSQGHTKSGQGFLYIPTI